MHDYSASLEPIHLSIIIRRLGCPIALGAGKLAVIELAIGNCQTLQRVALRRSGQVAVMARDDWLSTSERPEFVSTDCGTKFEPTWNLALMNDQRKEATAARADPGQVGLTCAQHALCGAADAEEASATVRDGQRQALCSWDQATHSLARHYPGEEDEVNAVILQV
ncbi:hypothetical protein NDU88_003293 [Pleurodeles waltl]|uniref:Uncharacterized protein n=1 Tax=Pleurodeles waltl TaxID=8319 RepID=A0AAV7P9M5_PLEWA|nr:hypothetical protein NDU88_003293 [Pleurodeles waltl]